MGWSFRKSASFGPFRLNFSKSGVGLSFGVRGARISTGKRGTYVTLGAGGITYRHKITPSPSRVNIQTEEIPHATEEVHTITSTNFEELTDSDSRAFIADLEEVEKKISFFKYFGVIPVSVILFTILTYITEPIQTNETFTSYFQVTKKTVNVREAPNVTAKILSGASEGERLKLLVADSVGWVKVEASGQQIGFVRSDLGEIKQKLSGKIFSRRYEKDPSLFLVLAATGLTGIIWCVWLFNVDRRRKSLDIFYEMGSGQQQMHEEFLKKFDAFMASRAHWQVLNEDRVDGDRRYFAGASKLVTRVGVKKLNRHKVPSSFLNTNIAIPHIGLRNTELYFFPERLLLKRRSSFAAVFYKNLNIEGSTIRFIEDGSLPSDALVVDYTWKYVNKSGGPDRRFSNNRRLPICNYSEYTFRSTEGINEIISTSKLGAMDELARFIETLGAYQKSLEQPLLN
jgi:hypothetical protein